MAVEIVDLLEIVEVADHDRERRAGAAAAGQFPRQMDEQRARIGQSGQVVGGRRVLRLLILESIFDRERDLRS